MRTTIYLIEPYDFKGNHIWTAEPPTHGEEIIAQTILDHEDLEAGWIGEHPISQTDVNAIKEELADLIKEEKKVIL